MVYRNLPEVKLSILIVLLWSIFSVVTARAAEAESWESWVDRDLFPEAYSILTSEHIMFPDDVSDWPLKINSTHQLFVDDYLISKIENLTRQYHQPSKHPQNPVLKEGMPVAVLHDESTGKFRMWYDMSYAESDDGITWTKPNLGTQGNLLFDEGGEIRGLIHDPKATNPQKRYLAVVARASSGKFGEKPGFFLYRSVDGLHWVKEPDRPILQRTEYTLQPGPYRGKGVGDTSTFRYDSVLQRYVCDAKFNLFMPKEKFEQLGIHPDATPRLRLRTMLESEDLIHWTSPRFFLYPDRNDAPDCQIYAHIGFVYESMWIGLVRIMHLIPAGWKQTDIQLTYSRDGRHWMRPQERQPFIPLGGPDSWEADYSGPDKVGPVTVGGELWFYYFGSRHPHRDNREIGDPQGGWPRHTGLAILRRDGFASLNAGQITGQVITRPLTFEGKSLFINATVANGGWVKAAVLSQDSQPVTSYTLDDAVSLTGDAIKGRMTWKTTKDLVSPGDHHVRLLFQLKDAKLYSFWIE